MSKDNRSLSEKVDAAFQATTTTVIERARQTGTRVVVWEDGHIKEIPPEQFGTATDQQDQKSATQPN